MNWKQLTLTIYNGNRMSRIPVTFTKTCKVEVWEDLRSEDDKESEEINICYSDLDYSSEDELEYNSWADEQGSSAFYLAEKEQTNKQNQ